MPQSRETSGVLFSRRWTTGRICWHFTSRSIRQKEASTGNRFDAFWYFAFTDRCKNVLLSVITCQSIIAGEYYAGCGNNMEEQQYDACCCSSQTSICHPRASATVDEACSQLVDLLQQTRRGDKRWRTMSGGKVFSGLPGLITSEQYVALKLLFSPWCHWFIAAIIPVIGREKYRATTLVQGNALRWSGPLEEKLSFSAPDREWRKCSNHLQSADYLQAVNNCGTGIVAVKIAGSISLIRQGMNYCSGTLSHSKINPYVLP